MLQYRAANVNDAAAIALLHAQSWQRHYRGIWSDAFLDGPVIEERMEVWQKRLTEPTDNQYVTVAESTGQLVGFVCMYAEEDPKYGALLDNLHVANAMQGKGIGKELMRRAAAWLYARNPSATFYLWVLQQNIAAQKFYDTLGGINQEVVAVAFSDGSAHNSCRYVWKDVKNWLSEQ